jgi:hypothetical protein
VPDTGTLTAALVGGAAAVVGAATAVVGAATAVVGGAAVVVTAALVVVVAAVVVVVAAVVVGARAVVVVAAVVGVANDGAGLLAAAEVEGPDTEGNETELPGRVLREGRDTPELPHPTTVRHTAPTRAIPARRRARRAARLVIIDPPPEGRHFPIWPSDIASPEGGDVEAVVRR